MPQTPFLFPSGATGAAWSVMLLGAALAMPAAAQTAPSATAATYRPAAPAIPPGARLAATCAACHGSNGATAGNTLPALAGQPREALLASLQAFKAGTRPATIMTQIAKGYSDAQLAELAAFFAAQPARPTATTTGPRPLPAAPALAASGVRP